MPTKRKVTEEAPAVLDTTLDEAPKKAPIKREDPIARAERLLEEARAKAKVEAEKQLANALANLDLGEKSLIKAAKIHTERRERVIMLKDRLGEDYELPMSASQVLFGLTDAQVESAVQHAEDTDTVDWPTESGELPTLAEVEADSEVQAA